MHIEWFSLVSLCAFSTHLTGLSQILRSRHESGKFSEMASAADMLSDSVLCRRAEHLVKAGYILTGQ